MNVSNAHQTNPTDDMIKRNRSMRWFVAITSPIVAIFLGWIIGRLIFGLLNFSLNIGGVIGVGVGTWVAFILIERSLIRNGAVQAFVTINPLKSLLQPGSALNSYGPGTHICYWWETRSKENNVFLGAVPEGIKGTVQCANGYLDKEGDFYLRPDITRLPQFLSGVGSSASNFTTLIEAEIVADLAPQDVIVAMKNVALLNQRLKEKFVEDKQGNQVLTNLEESYGVIIANVTIRQLLPSSQVAETIGAITESNIISSEVIKAVCKIYGIAESDYDEAVAKGRITTKQIDDARDRIMAMSNNLQGMNLSRSQFDFNITGLGDLPKDSVAALAIAAQSIAAMRGGAKQVGNPAQGSNRNPTKRRSSS